MTTAEGSRTESAQPSDACPRRSWTAPAVERIEAGSAEIGSDVIADGTTVKS